MDGEYIPTIKLHIFEIFEYKILYCHQKNFGATFCSFKRLHFGGLRSARPTVLKRYFYFRPGTTSLHLIRHALHDTFSSRRRLFYPLCSLDYILRYALPWLIKFCLFNMKKMYKFMVKSTRC